ncbi:Erp family outer-surface lipoprotein [Borreliella carolinensis]|uniref:Erp family outer-surface lipoprotein n=1 Tax=Borreliella carolinensis TaxID=478174 RepID=A0ACD5GM96_9SPIR
MDKIMKILIICAVFALISSCKNFTSGKDIKKNAEEKVQGFVDKILNSKVSEVVKKYDEQSGGESKVKKIEFSRFTVKIKNKDSSNNWEDLGTLVIQKEEDGIATGLNNDAHGGGHTATFFSLEEEEVNSFVKAMTEGGLFKTSFYFGYKEYYDDQRLINGIQNKEIITKIESINGIEHITFSGDKMKDSENKVAKYAIPLESLKKNLK